MVKKIILVLIIFLLFLSNCGNPRVNPEKIIGNYKPANMDFPDTVYYLDVIGENTLDKLIIRHNETNPHIRDIYLAKDRIEEKIISLNSWYDKIHVLTKPSVEMIYLQANYIQTNEKGIRIVIRNTDVSPDTIFIDLFFNDTVWIVKKYFLLNTDEMSRIKLFIESVDIDRPILDIFGEALVCDPKNDIILEYFPLTASLHWIK